MFYENAEEYLAIKGSYYEAFKPDIARRMFNNEEFEGRNRLRMFGDDAYDLINQACHVLFFGIISGSMNGEAWMLKRRCQNIGSQYNRLIVEDRLDWVNSNYLLKVLRFTGKVVESLQSGMLSPYDDGLPEVRFGFWHGVSWVYRDDLSDKDNEEARILLRDLNRYFYRLHSHQKEAV